MYTETLNGAHLHNYSGHQKSGDRVTENVQFYVFITCTFVLELSKNNEVNDFYIMLNCTYMHSRHAEGMVEMYFMHSVKLNCLNMHTSY